MSHGSLGHDSVQDFWEKIERKEEKSAVLFFFFLSSSQVMAQIFKVETDWEVFFLWKKNKIFRFFLLKTRYGARLEISYFQNFSRRNIPKPKILKFSGKKHFSGTKNGLNLKDLQKKTEKVIFPRKKQKKTSKLTEKFKNFQ